MKTKYTFQIGDLFKFKVDYKFYLNDNILMYIGEEIYNSNIYCAFYNISTNKVWHYYKGNIQEIFENFEKLK